MQTAVRLGIPLHMQITQTLRFRLHLTHHLRGKVSTKCRFRVNKKQNCQKHDSKTSIVRTPMGQLSVPSIVEFPEL